MTDTPIPARVLLGVSGSIALLSVPSYLQYFKHAGVAQVTVVLTRTAEQMLPVTTWRYLADEVYTDNEPGPGHIAIARAADATAVMPATANVIANLATGSAPSLLPTVLLATQHPITVAPMMNPQMWGHPAVRRNLRTLREDGHTVLEPTEGAAYEVATRSRKASLVLPAPDAVLQALAQNTQAVHA